jgi:hypothetical protein
MRFAIMSDLPSRTPRIVTMTTSDGRKHLRAAPPKGRMGRLVQVHVDSSTYRRLYDMATERETSLSEVLRDLITQAMETNP